MCNPTVVHQVGRNQSCEREDNQNLVRACREFPTVHPCSRYKNVFCEECNSGNFTNCSKFVHKERKKNKSLPLELEDRFYWSFTFTFGLSSYSEDFPHKKNPLACFPNQMYDNYYVSIYSFVKYFDYNYYLLLLAKNEF